MENCPGNTDPTTLGLAVAEGEDRGLRSGDLLGAGRAANRDAARLGRLLHRAADHFDVDALGIHTRDSIESTADAEKKFLPARCPLR